MEKWKKISEIPVKGSRRGLAKRIFQLPDGTRLEYEVLLEKNTICVLALTKNQKVILARQFRTGPEKILDELPGGKVEKGQTPLKAIEKELLEETGYTGKFKLIGKTISDAYSTRTRYHFVALDCKKISQPQNDDTEITETVLMEIDEFKKHLKSGELTDALTGYMGLNYLKIL